MCGIHLIGDDMIKIAFNTSEEEAAAIKQYKGQGYSIASIAKLKSGNTITFREPSAEVNLLEIMKVLVAKGILKTEELPPLIAAKIGGVK